MPKSMFYARYVQQVTQLRSLTDDKNYSQIQTQVNQSRDARVTGGMYSLARNWAANVSRVANMKFDVTVSFKA